MQSDPSVSVDLLSVCSVATTQPPETSPLSLPEGVPFPQYVSSDDSDAESEEEDTTREDTHSADVQYHDEEDVSDEEEQGSDEGDENPETSQEQGAHDQPEA